MASHTPITNSVKKHSLKRKVFTGTFIQSKNLTELEIWRDTCVCVDEHGVIVKIAEVRGEQDVLECVGELDWDREEVVFEGSNEGVGERFFFPGFIDTHIHAPQYPNSGLFGSSTLLNWLNTYTFPLESSLSSLPKAHAVYSRVIQRTLSPRHHNGRVLRHHPRRIDQSPRRSLPPVRPTCPHREMLHGFLDGGQPGHVPRRRRGAKPPPHTAMPGALREDRPRPHPHHGDPHAALRPQLHRRPHARPGRARRRKEPAHPDAHFRERRRGGLGRGLVPRVWELRGRVRCVWVLDARDGAGARGAHLRGRGEADSREGERDRPLSGEQ
ncbi:hypothetical protein EYC84_006115 [Monilinia fructicola]|uniref:Uncharacterized protein n=1 Tax=Monilinia fructicola TaxID=38448 RepID=A0A5M9K4V0_MONFR|nr:hypothetical protein EYC84_006115 [Monilinia fructicola]